MRLFFARIKEWVLNIVRFLTKDLWVLDFSTFSKAKQRGARYLKAVILSFRGFTNGRIGREAIALSRFTTLAFIPMAAVILFISKGFGLDEILYSDLVASFPTSNQLIDVIVKFATKIVDTTRSGLFGWISFGAFVWTILWLMINIETAFNRIWRVRNSRKLWKRILLWFGIILMTPFVLVLFLSGWIYYVRFIGLIDGKLGAFSFITTNLFWLALYGIVVMALSAMYKFIPQTRVRYGSALRAAIIAGALFVGLQYLYLGTQLMVTRLNAVYGALAFIPLFMIWMNLCWQLILYGATLSRGFTQVDMLEARERGLGEAGRFDHEKQVC